MPQQLSPFVEERMVAFALGHPGYGPHRVASELRQKRWGGIVVSHNGVWAACAGMVSTPAPSGSHSLPAGGDRTCVLIAPTNPAGYPLFTGGCRSEPGVVARLFVLLERVALALVGVPLFGS
jgi:hypothetical protein